MQLKQQQQQNPLHVHIVNVCAIFELGNNMLWNDYRTSLPYFELCVL